MENGFVNAIDQNEVMSLMQDITFILEECPDFTMDLDDFLSRFQSTYEITLSIDTIKRQLFEMLILSEPDNNGKITVALAPLRIFAREITQILEDVGGSLMISNVDAVYLQKYVH